MEFRDAVEVEAPTRFSLAGAFAIAVVLASMMHAPADPFANLGPFGLFGVDKWVHVGSYALVAFLLSYAYLAKSVWALVAIAILTFLLGTGVELLQSTIPWRTMEAADVTANTIGTLIGIGSWQLVWW